MKKTKGYPFQGTVLAVFKKIDEDEELAAVQIEPGPNASGLVYFHRVEHLTIIDD